MISRQDLLRAFPVTSVVVGFVVGVGVGLGWVPDPGDAPAPGREPLARAIARELYNRRRIR